MASPCAPKKATTMNGNPYDYLEAPGTFQIKAQGGNILDKVPDKEIEKIGSFWIECEYIRTNGLPLDPRDTKAANPRAPDCEHSVVKEMKSTLLKTPQQFTTLNGGISIVCDDITQDTKNPDIFHITLQDGDGIVNGGHTYYSINSSNPIDPSALAKIEFIQIASTVTGTDRRHIIKQIAVSKNKNRAISDESEANFLGYFEPWKKAMGPYKDHISWKDGATCKCIVTGNQIENPMTATQLIKWIGYFEYANHNYHYVYNPNRTGAKQPGKVHWDAWVNVVNGTTDPYSWMMPLALPIIQLKEDVFNDLTNISRTVPMTSLVKRRGKATGGPLTKIRSGRAMNGDFGEWLISGGKKRKKKMIDSFFDTSQETMKGHAFAEMIIGNFRSMLWRKRTPSGQVLVGWQVNPWEVWQKCRDAIIGALYWEWDDGGWNALNFRRNVPAAQVIDLCEWVTVGRGAGKKPLRQTIDAFTPPWVIYHDNEMWIMTDPKKATRWLNINSKRPEMAEFDKKSKGSHSFGYMIQP